MLNLSQSLAVCDMTLFLDSENDCDNIYIYIYMYNHMLTSTDGGVTKSVSMLSFIIGRLPLQLLGQVAFEA